MSSLLQESFFDRDALEVAQDLIGKRLCYNGREGIIVETEGYKQDSASHAQTKTERSKLMWESYGRWYIYLIYGMYHCLNITTNGKDDPGAVLIRAVKPVESVDEMRRVRGMNDIEDLCSGPGKLCESFGITLDENGSKLNDTIILKDGISVNEESILSSSRVGISEATDLQWRYYLSNEEKFVS